MWADGESHKRQRKTINPAFGAAAVRSLTSIFQDVAHKAVIAWDAEIGSNSGTDCAVIDVQQCSSTGISHKLVMLAQSFPSIMKLPLPRTQFAQKFNLIIGKICEEMLLRTRKEKETGGADQGDKSCMGLLLKAEESGEGAGLTPQEVLAQARMLLFGSFETTAGNTCQTKLRNECLEFGSTPSYDDLMNKLPYLNAVVNEVLRLHPSVIEILRAATQEEVIPLSEPMHTAAGNSTDNVSMWGRDAKAFKPSRWLKEDEGAGETLRDYRHLMTFGNGARTCPGRLFALAEFKAVLFVLVQNFVFEMADGPGVKIAGCSVPLRVRRYDV
ncbi:cytochrome P450 [Suillus subalutaceus]|uniref:cytochrome P450 n=1 Tax=Suillus subalutaceus TaxID=48586 RepID=UPI001B869ED9|nr:cytochrome P450 [Suillus subalutaceus]KAG1839555.1 cytochrome P450 [Suillus subalutaceus]